MQPIRHPFALAALALCAGAQAQISDGAVKIGNPFDKSLTRDAAKPALVGGVEGGRYEGKLPNGQRAVSYVVVKDGHRLVVLLKGPPGSPYKELTDAFAKSVEGFVWQAPAAQ